MGKFIEIWGYIICYMFAFRIVVVVVIVAQQPSPARHLIQLFLHPAAEIMILEGPDNATAEAGDAVTFHCRFNGTLNLPLWDIGRRVYSSAYLPPGFQYSLIQDGLYIPSVWKALNNTLIACFFTVHDGGGHLSRIESSPAYLIVYDKENENEDKTPTSKYPINVDETSTYASSSVVLVRTKLLILVSLVVLVINLNLHETFFFFLCQPITCT